jgi:transcriptional regulator with XRE-family HTH domain
MSKFYRHALGEVLRDRRIALGHTLRTVSGTGCISLGYLSEVEHGHKEVSSEILENIAEALRTTVYSLIIETGYRMEREATEIPNTAESLFRDKAWEKQYSDLVR